MVQKISHSPSSQFLPHLKEQDGLQNQYPEEGNTYISILHKMKVELAPVKQMMIITKKQDRIKRCPKHGANHFRKNNILTVAINAVFEELS